MGRWLDRAARLEAEAGSWDNRDNRDNSSPETADAGPIAPNDPNAPSGLPRAIHAGLETLRTMPAPRRIDGDAWREVVADALQLASSGWIVPAMRLGWTALDLFGAVTDRTGDPESDGLAVKLNGRRLVAISDQQATVADAHNGRSYLYRRSTEGARLLWELGGGR